MWMDVSLALLLTDLAICLLMLFIVPRNRGPAAATAWLLLIFFVPIGGLVLYLLIGRNPLPRRRVKHHQRILESVKQVRQRLNESPNTVSPDLPAGFKGFVELAESLSNIPILGGNDVDFLADPYEVVDRIVADIESARDHVNLLFYIFQDDDTGWRVINALIEAAGRGVEVRLLVDAVGSRSILRRRKLICQKGIDMRAVLPVGLFRRRFARLDVRNHRKIVIVDGQIAWTGSQNIIDPDYGQDGSQFEDTMVRLRGPAVMELQLMFAVDWYFESDELLEQQRFFPEPQRVGQVAAQALPSGPNFPSENFSRILLAALYAAHHRVVMTTPYFVPDNALLQAMNTASMRGVRVDLIVPENTDHLVVDAAGHAYYEQLLKEGVRIYIYKKNNLHSKLFSIDSQISFVGSSNFDIRSFVLNFEANMLFYGPEMTERVLAQQEHYLANADELDLETWQNRPMLRRFEQNLAKLTSPLL